MTKLEITARDVDAIYEATDLLREMVKADIFFGTEYKELKERVEKAFHGLAGIYPVSQPTGWSGGFAGVRPWRGPAPEDCL